MYFPFHLIPYYLIIPAVVHSSGICQSSVVIRLKFDLQLKGKVNNFLLQCIVTLVKIIFTKTNMTFYFHYRGFHLYSVFQKTKN